MTLFPESLEQRLIAAYRRQAVQYERAYCALTASALDHDGAASELQSALAEIATIDASFALDKADWQKSGRSPGPAFREVLQEVAEQIRRVAEQVDRHVAVLTTKRETLVPELDGFLRERRMLQAYDQYNTSH